MKTYDGILDHGDFPARLPAQVVEPCEDPRVHGYAIQADLGHAIGFLELGWLALIGELPSVEQREALARALIWLAPLHVGEGPTHAAVLARIAGAPDEVVPAIASAAIGQHVAQECRTLARLFAWLDEPSGPIPKVAIELHPTPEQVEAHERLAADSVRWFGADRALPASPVLRRVAAGHALLHRLGVREPLLVQALATWARLPIALAEAARTRSGAIMSYPAQVPPYRYVETEEVE